MSAPRPNELTAVVICPDPALGRQLRELTHSRHFVILEELNGYPTLAQIETRLRQLRPDVALVDLSTDVEEALGLVSAVSQLPAPPFVVGVHTRNDAEVIIRSLRAGGTEFLAPPFDADSIAAVSSRIRRLQESQSKEQAIRGKVFAFVGAKPGQGVTTVASNVAAAVSNDGKRRTLLMDCDLLGSTLSFCWRVTHSYSLLDALQHSDRIDDALWGALVTNRNGVDLLLGPDSPEKGGLHGEPYVHLIEYTRMRYEVIVIDLPSVYAPEAQAMLPECDHVFMVCNPELPSLHLTRRAINRLEQEGFSRDQFSLILNRLSRRGELGPQDMERVFNFPISKVLPEDEGAVHRALTAGKPVPDSCELGKQVLALGQSLLGKGKEVKKKAAAGLMSALLQS